MGNNKRIDAWNTLRFIFIIGVVLYHTNSYFNRCGTSKLYFVYRYGGFFCNYFFFMLSGVLMAMTWKDRLSKGNIPIGTFLVKRVAVIYPIYLLGEFLAIAYKLLHEGWGAITVKHLLTDALFITTGWIDGGVKGPYDGPTWFMCVLVCCYCLYYIICRITSKSRDAYLIAITMMVLLGSYLEHSGLEIPFLYRTSGEGYMNFFFGTLLHAVYDAAHKRAKLKIVKICIGGVLCWF